MSEIIKQAAVLRGQRKFDEAIELIEQNLTTINPDIKVMALLQAFYAAVEANYIEKAKKFAKMIFTFDPLIPSIQEYL